VITKFSVSNFKSFNEEFILNLSDTNGYNFNNESVKNGVVNNAIVYGKNGVGKSNLGLAMFDIISHLTDNETRERLYTNYLNANNESKEAKFKYEFIFNSKKIIYEYRKTNSEEIIFEKFLIDGEVLAYVNKTENEVIVKFKGAENLKTDLPKNLSLLKYIKNNTILEDNSNNIAFQNFFDFVEKMLFFRSLEDRTYIGLEVGAKSVTQDIIEKNNVSDLEEFLNIAGIKCNLTIIKESEKEVIAFDFGDKQIELFRIASQGTKALVLFYFWLQRIREDSKVSFLFIDEFDAFYHHKLSALVVKKLKETGVQLILTTHNTSIMTNDLLRPDCYFIMNDKEIKSFSKSNQKELREAHNIEKMYKAGLFNV
jgi:AAA15 family ATPase/GTPase